MGFGFCSSNEDRDFKLQLNAFITNSSVRPKAFVKTVQFIKKSMQSVKTMCSVITEFLIKEFNCTLKKFTAKYVSSYKSIAF
jgi:hypothetical protein